MSSGPLSPEQQMIANHVIAQVSRTIMRKCDQQLTEVRQAAAEMTETILQLERIVKRVVDEMDQEDREEQIADLEVLMNQPDEGDED